MVVTRVAAQYVPPDFYGETYMKSIGFWENSGQIVDTDEQPRPDIHFYSEGAFPRAYLRDKSRISFVVAVVDTNPGTTDTLYRLDMRPAGHNANEVAPQGWAQKDWQQNYYMAHTGTAGAAAVIGYSRVFYEDIYPGIDLHFYSGSKGQKMAFVLRPGCSPDDLKLAFNGQDSIAVDLWGNLKIYKDGRWMVMPFAQAYQVTGGGAVVPISWSASYQVDNGAGVVGFQWSSYNADWPLVFQIGIPPFGPAFFDEPGLCWSTYMGGNQNDDVYESVEDENGNYYIVGTTGSTFASFPQAPGTVYSSAGTVAYMMKFNPDDDIEWKTFFGGNAAADITRGRAIGHKVGGQVYMGGFSDSEALPVYQDPNGIEFYQPTATGPGNKGFIGRFDRLSGIRDWASYYGHNDVYIHGMHGLGGKKLFIVGATNSQVPPIDVPPPPNSTYWDYSSETDGFVAMFNDDDQHAWRTHIPGSANDDAYDVFATGNRVVVSGVTHSQSLFNLVPYGGNPNSVRVLQGLDDCYLYEFDENGGARWGTCVGSAGYDASFHNGVAIDPVTGDVALVGQGGLNLDVVQGPGWYQSSYPPSTAPGFIARFSGQDRSRIWHTYVHNGPLSATSLTACAFDPYGKLLVAGSLRDGNGALLQPLPGLYQQSAFNADVNGTSSEPKDPVVLAFGPGNQLLYGSYFGGEANAAFPEAINNVLHRRLNGNIYLVGATSKESDPTSYFPLDDGGGTPYFEELWQGGNYEGFLASICAQALNTVGVAEGSDPGRRLIATWSLSGLDLQGVPEGLQPYSITDAAGRIFAQGALTASADRLQVPLPTLAQGVYAIRFALGHARFVVAQ